MPVIGISWSTSYIDSSRCHYWNWMWFDRRLYVLFTLLIVLAILMSYVTPDLIYASSSRVNLSIFLVVSTNVLFLLGAGLFSKGVAGFNQNAFNTLVGAGDIGELGAGPGSYNVVGSVWQLSYGIFCLPRLVCFAIN